MKTTHWLLVAALIGGVACGQDDAEERAREAARAAAEQTEQMAEAATEAADEAAAAARAVAADAAAAAEGAARDAAARVEEAVGDDPAARCNALAASGSWAEALEPCTRAHQADPDDMAIEHALQQAKAAAKQ